MSRAPFIFSALLVVFAVLIFNSLGDLPARVAVHFDTNNAPDGWVTRQQYGLYALLLLIGLPLLLFAAMAGVPRVTGGKGQIPNHEYWFATERNEQTKSYLVDHSSWLGTMTVAVLYGTHVILMRANELNPPKISSDRFLTMIFGLVGCHFFSSFSESNEVMDHRSSSAIRLDVSQRLPPMDWISE
jgi:uncharacterized membrane protein